MAEPVAVSLSSLNASWTHTPLVSLVTITMLKLRVLHSLIVYIKMPVAVFVVVRHAIQVIRRAKRGSDAVSSSIQQSLVNLWRLFAKPSGNRGIELLFMDDL